MISPRFVLLAGLVLSCAADPAPSDSESSSSTGASPGSTSSTVTADGSSSSSSTAPADSSSSSESGPVVLSIAGVANDFFGMAPIAGAEISLVDEPGFETVSARDGSYVIEGLPAESFHRIRLADSEMFWGAIVPATLEQDPLDDFDLSQVSLAVIDLQESALQQQDPRVMVDPEAAVFIVVLRQNTATGAKVILDPPAPVNTFYAPDANGAPVLNADTILWGIYPVAVIFNLAPADAGTYTVSVTHPERECTVEDPTPPTLARHINLLYVDCPAS
jgi:hypothetical protein